METILVVDDDAMVLSLCQNILKLGGYSILSASSGAAALRIAQNATVDLALLDVMMPGMNGVELARRLQETHPGTRIVLMTGFGPRDIAPIVGSHDFRVIWKPFKTESLLRMIENALGRSASPIG
jgi:CheY-like chemotaxis protein